MTMRAKETKRPTFSAEFGEAPPVPRMPLPHSAFRDASVVTGVAPLEPMRAIRPNSAPKHRANFSFSMPDGREPEEWDTRATSKLSPSWWLARIFPSKSRRSDKPRIGERLRDGVLKQ